MNNFDELAKLALDEGTLSDYMNAVKRASNAAVKKPIGKKIAKSAIKGAARLPGQAVQVAGGALKGLGALAGGLGKVYSAIGGSQGGAALQNIGSRVKTAGGVVSAAGQKIAAAPEAIHSAITKYGKSYEFNQKYLQQYKDIVLQSYPKLPKATVNAIKSAGSLDKVNEIVKREMPGVKLSDLSNKLYGKSNLMQNPKVQQSINAQQTTTPTTSAAPQTTTVPSTSAANTQPQQTTYKPKLKVNRSMVKDTNTGVVYKYLGKKQGGWYEYDSRTKTISKQSAPRNEQKRITDLWRTKEIANKTKKTP